MSERRETDPRYPIYVISKGRWDSRYTSKTLEKMGVSYHIVIEPQEYNEYASVISPDKILALPFSELGQGSIPARNWVWEHAISMGAERHWILDDNISGFFRYNYNLRVPVYTGAIFRASEDFVDRYENVALAGFQYRGFANSCRDRPVYIPNTRIYSCILIKNDIPYRWRGKYNEDTDLSLRVLKDGWCTILFVAFLQGKVATMVMRGGNTDELYQGDGRKQMAESLVEQHPDVARVSSKFGRVQHHVDYRPFKKNKLIRKPDIIVPQGINNYGMVLEGESTEGESITMPICEEEPLFVADKAWEEEWKGMPEYVQMRTEYHCIKVSFVSKEDMNRFANIVGQPLSLNTKIIYYPQKPVESSSEKRYVEESSGDGEAD